VLFTDIVGSTERAAEIGDRAWKGLIGRHHAIVRRELRRFHGRELDTAGDGFFAAFEQPVDAIGCATAIIDDLRPLDLRIRAGIHMGETEVIGDKVGGITVHVASRTLAAADPGEILVTNTVREVTAGADVRFMDRGTHRFKGVPGSWRVYAVELERAGAEDQAASTPGPVEASVARGAASRPVRLGVGLVGIAVMAVAVYAVTRPPPVPPIVPQPDSALRFDAANGTPTAIIPALDSPTGIAIDGETVWVLSQGNRLLTAFGGGTPRPIGLPGVPTGIAAGDGSAWVSFGYGAPGERAGMVMRASARTQRLEDRIPVDSGAGEIALDAAGVWVVNGNADSLTRIDPATRSVANEVTVGQQPVDVAVGEGAVWVAHGVDGSVWRIDPRTLDKSAEITLGEGLTAIAVGFGRAWVTSDAGGTVVVIDAATNRIRTTITIEQGPRGVAAGSDAIWVACARGTLVRIDPATMAVTASWPLPGPAEGVAVLGSSVWVTVQR
jgi:YVTN family beta-propeller protein